MRWLVYSVMAGASAGKTFRQGLVVVGGHLAVGAAIFCGPNGWMPRIAVTWLIVDGDCQLRA